MLAIVCTACRRGGGHKLEDIDPGDVRSVKVKRRKRRVGGGNTPCSFVINSAKQETAVYGSAANRLLHKALTGLAKTDAVPLLALVTCLALMLYIVLDRET